MKLVPFLLSALVTIGLIFFFNMPIPMGDSFIPPLGKFFNPFQGFWQNTKVDSRFANETFDFEGLNDKVTLVYDERRVPHIFAENTADAYFVQGYVTAKDRLWQMDISTRSSAGRLSEILGNRTFEIDKRARRMGMLKAAEDVAHFWSKEKESREKIDAYINGVNSYVESLSPDEYPIELKLLDYKPEKWSILKCAQFYKSMERSLNSREYDLEHSNLVKAFGLETFNYLFPNRNVKESPILPKGIEFSEKVKTPSIVDSIQSFGFLNEVENYDEFEKEPDFIGSNNWVVDGSKTASGNPILCNDPHLVLNLPAVWYELQLHTPTFNCYGVSFPGIPGITIGFNENIAWGTTNGGHDVKDWYRIKWADENHNSYLLDGNIVEVEKRVEEIKVKGQPTVYDTVKYTQWGPIYSESETSPYKDLALRWISNEVANDFVWKTFWGFNEAKNHNDFIRATNHYGHPNQNFVFASKEGDIALKVSGKIPIKGKNQGKFIQDGSSIKNDWKGFIPQSDMPQALNPAQGFLSSANQAPTDDSYSYHYGGVFNHYRGRIINRKLDSMSNISPKDMMRLLMNNESILAEELLPQLIKYLDNDELNALQLGFLKILEDWDFSFDKDDIAPMLFEAWRQKFRTLTWDEMLAVDEKSPVILPADWRAIEILDKDPLNEFFDRKATPEKEGPKEIVTTAFLEITEELKDKLEDKNYTWTDFRSSDINHMARLPGFSRTNIEAGGYKEAINALQGIAGPSWRMVVEMGEEVKAWGVFPGGQSGEPASKFYDNAINSWCEGDFYELYFMKNSEDQRQPILFKQEFK